MSLSDFFDAYCAAYQPYKDGRWCYEDGCVYRGLDLLFEATGEPRWRAHLHRLADAQIAPDGSLLGYDPDEFNIDNVLSGRILFPLARETGDPRYMAAATRLFDQLQRHPRIPAGNYWHKKRYAHQVWLDGLYMGLPFQIEYSLATGRPPGITDAIDQLNSALDASAIGGGLYVHGYDDSRSQVWADPKTGRSPAVWARAMGWLAMALVDALAILPGGLAIEPLPSRTQEMLRALAALQNPSGLWPQVLAVPDLAGNYEETSASAMFAYAFLRAARARIVDAPTREILRSAGTRAMRALMRDHVVFHDGAWHMRGICQVAGLGTFDGIYRDGSPGYYLTEAIVEDDAKGVGPLMMAYAEFLRLEQAAV